MKLLIDKFSTNLRGYVSNNNIVELLTPLQIRIAALLDKTWRPNPNDVIEHHVLFSPLSTANFTTVIKSDATRDVRTRLFAQILEGLAFLHSKGVAHRDIKPANLTVKTYDPPDAQIIDFGCATFEADILYDRPGTIPYLAPEQCEGKYHNQSVDYWAVALVGIEMLGYKRTTNIQVTRPIHEEIHHWLDGQPNDPMIECCKGMLQWEPGERMSAADALEAHLVPFQNAPGAAGDGKRLLEVPGQFGRR
jgi:serine/threonine protein kinase